MQYNWKSLVAISALACAPVVGALAQDPQPDALDAAFSHILSGGLTDDAKVEETRWNRVFPPELLVRFDDGMERNFRAKRGMTVRVRAGLVTTDARAEAATARMAEIHEVFRTNCEAQGGELEPIGEPNWSPESHYRGFQRMLLKAGVIGPFPCRTESVPLFQVEITPALHGTLGRWPVAVVGLGQERLAEVHSARAEELAAAQMVRAELKPGDRVSIEASNVPMSLRLPARRSIDEYYQCAMVLQVNQPLAEVQIEGETLFIEIDKIEPGWESISLGNRSMVGEFDGGPGRCFTR